MKEKIRKLLLAICICIFCFAAYNLVHIYYQYEDINKGYAAIKEGYTAKVKDSEYLNIDWQQLKQRNEDVIAWIQIPDTNIDYPVLRGENNDEYLRHDIDHNYLVAGCIFVDSNNQNPFVDYNTIIYGHSMNNGSMFGDLDKFLDSTYVDNHPYIYLYLPNETVSKYKIVVSHILDSRDELYNCNVTDLPDYYQKMQKDNQISVEFDQTKNVPVIMLSTCVGVRGNDRYVVHAIQERTGIDPNQ